MSDYPLISDHGLIGDLQTAALVTSDGEIDWYCPERFDSPSVFASLLGGPDGGRCRVAAVGDGMVTRQMYLPDTAVLVTRFMSEAGVGSVIDFMPVAADPTVATDCHRIVRLVRVVRGSVDFDIECLPHFDYARGKHEVELTASGAMFSGADGSRLAVHTIVGAGGDDAAFTRDGDGVRMRLSLTEGQAAGLVIESGRDASPRAVTAEEVAGLLDGTVAFWRSWVARSTYTGRWREMVMRSAITLKLMTYAPTGAIVAAPTAALPEQVGGERNWDYRYTWVRDGSLSVHALLGLGYTAEAAAFGTWLGTRLGEHVKASPDAALPIMFRIDGSSDLPEFTLDHLEGYKGSSPVRIGNAAGDQLQLDIYGEAMQAVALAYSHGIAASVQGWDNLVTLMNWLCRSWDQPDEGIWETRGGRQPFVYGRVMSWVALDRAITIARDHGRPAPIAEWTAARDAIFRQVVEKGWNPEVGAFVQFNGSSVLDASLLRMPIVGMIPPSDPMWRSTLTAMDRVLVSDSLVYRYDPAASPDGLRGSEGTFTMCTFWYVDALAVTGRLEEARLVFEKMHTYASPLGLFGEEIALTGDQLGNFPQAFSHLGLINSALLLNSLLDDPSAQREALSPAWWQERLGDGVAPHS